MKHLKDYKQYLTEQALPPMPGDPAAGAAPVPPKQHLFAFVGDKEDDGIRRRKYPDGSVVIEYLTYSTTEPSLQDWVKKNVTSGEKQKHTDSDLEVKRKNLIEIVKGKKTNLADTDLTFIEKLKNAVSTGVFGKKEAIMEVVFTQDGSPTTNAINVTFIRIKK